MHSSSIFAPFVRVDIYSSTKRSPKTKKATSRLVSPRWWPRNSSDAASSGAGYDDQYDNNNNDDRYRQTGQPKYTEEPVCETARNEYLPECTLQVLEMQDGGGIRNVYWGICDARIVADVGAALSETEFGGWCAPDAKS